MLTYYTHKNEQKQRIDNIDIKMIQSRHDLNEFKIAIFPLWNCDSKLSDVVWTFLFSNAGLALRKDAGERKKDTAVISGDFTTHPEMKLTITLQAHEGDLYSISEASLLVPPNYESSKGLDNL